MAHNSHSSNAAQPQKHTGREDKSSREEAVRQRNVQEKKEQLETNTQPERRRDGGSGKETRGGSMKNRGSQ